MEDWEQFFVEKSRRRADKDRAERRRRQRARYIIATVLALAIIAGVAELAIRH